MVLPLLQAQAVVTASGKYKGISSKPWMQGRDSPVLGGMPWVCALAKAPIPDLWAKLASDPQISSHFGVARGSGGQGGDSPFWCAASARGVGQGSGGAVGGGDHPAEGGGSSGVLPHELRVPRGWLGGLPAGVPGGIRGGCGGYSRRAVRTPPSFQAGVPITSPSLGYPKASPGSSVSGGPPRCKVPRPSPAGVSAREGDGGDAEGAASVEGVDAAAHARRVDML